MASFADSGTSLSLVLGTNENVAITSTGSTYSLSLGATGTWSGTNDTNVTGNGSSTLTVTNSGLTAFTAGINITDAGSGGGDAVVFNDSTTSTYANSFSITLVNSSSGASTPGLAFNGATTFSSNSTLTASVNGDVIINSGATLTTYSGTVSLLATGANAPLTVNGNLISRYGTLTLQATGAVTVGADATVNSGNGGMTLAADVTASGTGDDGIGTLTISAGATVTSSNISSNAIILRGADVNISTGGNPAVISDPAGLITTASTTLLGLNDPALMAFDSSGNLYVANSGNGSGTTVSKFCRAVPLQARRLPGYTAPAIWSLTPAAIFTWPTTAAATAQRSSSLPPAAPRRLPRSLA